MTDNNEVIRSHVTDHSSQKWLKNPKETEVRKKCIFEGHKGISELESSWLLCQAKRIEISVITEMGSGTSPAFVEIVLFSNVVRFGLEEV